VHALDTCSAALPLLVAGGLLLAACVHGGGKAPPQPPGTLLEFRWSGGIAGFQRRLEIRGDGLARVEDYRAGLAAEKKLGQQRLQALLDLADSVMTAGAGPFENRIVDDFRYVIVRRRADGDSLAAEGNATAFPEAYRPLLETLRQLVWEVLREEGTAGPGR